jgi:thiol-disulfide isomerase/thioredoxin
MKTVRLPLILFLLTTLVSTAIRAQFPLESGRWHAEIQLNDSTNLPFILHVMGDSIIIENAEERVKMDVLSTADDSILLHFPLYDSEVRIASLGPIATGEYINHAKSSNNVFFFRCIKEPSYRCFMDPKPPATNLTGRWRLAFEDEEGVDEKNVMLLEQKGNKLTGSVLTTTGDHRYLDGEITGNRIQLSTFNGAFAFLYTGSISNDSTVSGEFYSGHTGHAKWTARRDQNASLPDAATLTGMKQGCTKLAFSFPDTSGHLWSLENPVFAGKVVVVQIMGTWCPNCLDESVFLNRYLAEHHSEGFEVIAIDYERSSDWDKIRRNISRVNERLRLTYPIVYGGNANRDSSSASLPMLEKIMAYPTSVIIDRKGVVRKIHTGFSGPATGNEYLDYMASFDSFVRELLKENR